MTPSLRDLALFATIFLGAAALGTPSIAGMTQDLEDCTAADRKTSADACTRVMNSGRLPDEQLYIGYYNRAWSYFRFNEYDKSLADFDKSIKHNPNYADTYYSRAFVLHERGDFEQSLADLDRYLDKMGEVAEAYIKRAQLFRRRGDLNRAFSELQRAAALDPGDRKVEMMRALVLSDLGEQRPARIDADKAIADQPKEAGAYYARALISFREHDLAGADADATKALSLKDTFPAAHTLKGRIHEERGEKADAVAQYQAAIYISPKSVDARSAQEEAKKHLTDLTGSATAAVAATELEPAKGEDCRRFIPSAATTVAVDCPK